jgi:hypothetical protein
MLVSDLHIEERVTLAATAGMNEYNPTIAGQMIDRCAEGFEWLTRDPRWDMREAVIWLGGDLFSGYIHDELQETNFMSPVQATVWLRDRLTRLLLTILKNTKFERIIIPCNDGNHGRLTHKIRASTRTANSLEWLLYKTLAAQFEKEPRLEFRIAEGLFTYVDIFGEVCAFTHGDQFQYQGGVGGMLIPIRRGLNEVRKYRDVRFFSMGHHHTYTPGVDITINGSGIGINPWAISKNFPPEPRQQAYFLIDQHGRKTLSAPIWGPKTGTI